MIETPPPQTAAPAKEKFGQDYFMRGVETGLSNYENYTWRRNATVFCAQRMALYMGCKPGDSILDYGCARGYYVRALALCGYNAYGVDISRWAIENCDPEVRGLVSNSLPEERPQWIFCKDVLEHIGGSELRATVLKLMQHAKHGVLIIVPLGEDEKSMDPRVMRQFIAPQDNADKTHVTCLNLPEWLGLIQEVIDTWNLPWVVQGGYKLPGVKEACDPYPGSVAFITARRLM
jgi:hypothetical protein